MRTLEKDKSETIWVLVHTKTGQEIKANKNLQNQGFITFLPLITRSNKEQSNDVIPVFPRYLFVQINLKCGNWTSINSSYGVSQIVMFSEKFTSIPNDLILSIRNKLDGSDTYKEEVSSVDFEKGDSVFIKEGRLAGLEAIFLSKKSKDRVRLLLKLLNTSVVTEIIESNIGHKEITKNFKF